MKKVAISCSSMITETYLSRVKNIFQLAESGCSLSETELSELLAGLDGFIMGGEERITENVLEHASPKWFTFIGIQSETSFPGRSLEICKSRNIPIYKTGGGGKAVAQTTFEQIAYCNPAWHRSQFKDVPKSILFEPQFSETLLSQQSVSVIGAGGIGGEVLRMLRGKCKKLVYSGGTGVRQELKDEGFVYEQSLENAFNADVVTIHLAVIPGVTEKLIRMRHLAQLNQHALLINNARAELFNPEDLLTFLKARSDVMSVFDVYWAEGAELDDLIKDESNVLTRLYLQPNFLHTGHSAAKRGVTYKEYGEGLLRIINDNHLAD
jgi:phosphoglycerate dehydrogenase-like enzyme